MLPVSTVVQSSLQPLCGGGVEGISREGHEEAGQGTAPLTPHWVPLVSHGRGANLGGLEGLLQLLLAC